MPSAVVHFFSTSVIIFSFCYWFFLTPALAQDSAQDQNEATDAGAWEEMPAGARPVYIGIHGGTAPVSLLTAGDGSPMIAQVGLTGTDFLNFMRRKLSLPQDQSQATSAEIPNTTKTSPEKKTFSGEHQTESWRSNGVISVLPSNTARLFLNGQSGGDVPVIYATGRAFERLSLIPDSWAPFGLTENALSLEGKVQILNQPRLIPKKRSSRKQSKYQTTQ